MTYYPINLQGQEVTHGLDGGLPALRHAYSASYAKVCSNHVLCDANILCFRL